MKCKVFVVALLSAGLLCGGLLYEGPLCSTAAAQDYQPRTVLAKPIRAITDPPIVSAAKTDLDENELVIGVVVADQARAYPINQLTGPSREIINDVLGGQAIAATW